MSPFEPDLQRIFASLGEGVWQRDLTTGRSWHSPRYKELLGFADDELGDDEARFAERGHPDDRAAIDALRERALATFEPCTGEGRMRMRDGAWRWFRATLRAWPDAAGRPAMLCGSLIDVHVEKQAVAEAKELADRFDRALGSALELAESRRAAAERANLAKASFLAHMSHELRTPLNGVMGLTQLAARSATSETQRRYLHLAEESGRTLLRILNDVLDFAKAEAGKLRLVSEPFDVPALVAETVRSLTPQIGARPIHMLFDDRGDLTHASGDAGRLRQIVSNLVGNALKFTERGAIEVVVTMAAQPAAKTRVRIVVRDSGAGMDEATLQRVFEAFEQGESGMARRHGGTGLGLTIVRQLTQLMDGRVEVASAPGAGTTFTVELLLGAAAQPAAPEAATAPGHAWLLYLSTAPARWVRQRLAEIGWSAEIFGATEAVLARLADPGAALPDCLVVADQVLTDATTLATLRRALPPRVPLSLILRPDFRMPALHESPPLAGVHVVLAPMTRRALGTLVRPAPAPHPAEETTQPLPLRAVSPKVLVVEDIETNRLIVAEMLRVLGMRVDVAESGEDALAACRRTTPDLVLMDIQMPGMDGLEATRRLRALQHGAALPSFPIVALTANAMDSDRLASRAAGVDEHVAKPVDLQQLRAVLSRWLPGFGVAA